MCTSLSFSSYLQPSQPRARRITKAHRSAMIEIVRNCHNRHEHCQTYHVKGISNEGQGMNSISLDLSAYQPVRRTEGKHTDRKLQYKEGSIYDEQYNNPR